MEIDITEFFKSVDTWPLSGSIATHGPNAGPDTWNNARQEARESPILKTKSQLDAMRQWAKETGAWSREEIKAWSPEEINALFIQLVSGDMREAGLDEVEFDSIDWENYKKRAENELSGSIHLGDDGNVYYDLGS